MNKKFLNYIPNTPPPATSPRPSPNWSRALGKEINATLIITHNKTLAAQLYSEFKEFFPNNAVEYFVSY